MPFMSQRVLVRGQLSWWTVVLRFGGPLVLLAGVFGYLAEPALGITLLAIGFLLTLTVEVWLFNIRRQRRWVEDKGSGFQIEDRAGLRTIADEQVFSLAYYKRRVHSEGILKGVWRHFLVWVEGESVPFEMQNWIPDEQTDPLSGLIARLLEKSLDRAALTLERGGQISGEGWTLDNSFLLLPGKPLPEQVRFDELSAVEVFDEHLCIWRR